MDERRLENLLDKLSIKVNVKGYQYWITAIKEYINDKSIKKCLLYEKVAEIHNSTAANIERALRFTLKNNQEEIQKYFNVSYKIDNSVFLELVTREIERTSL